MMQKGSAQCADPLIKSGHPASNDFHDSAVIMLKYFMDIINMKFGGLMVLTIISL
uniref:Uncharacterized protein n=1 Tax=Candidatus Nitrotoga fabula TaxID=2182327 RepID=A0A2X0SKU5_9PROT|nr:protein of unknown function [Candidatus Nitrotoga fabula]